MTLSDPPFVGGCARLYKYWTCQACRFTTYRHRFARAAPAPRAKRNDSKNRGRASPVNVKPARSLHFARTARALTGCYIHTLHTCVSEA